jgi:D-glycero-alpha-D-manno-heptose-7-phosphate kinase
MRTTRATAPTRIDLAGGWTDVPIFAEKYGGEVVNFAINIYAQADVGTTENGMLTATYRSNTRLGAGLGTTGAVNVALLAAIDGGKSDPLEIAENAYQFEMQLGNTGGRQDQWAAALGGFNHLLFIGERVERLPLEPLQSSKNWLSKHLILVDSGIEHVSGEMHQEVWEKFKKGDSKVEEGLLMLRTAAKKMADGLNRDRRDSVVESLKQVCEGVDLIDEKIHAPFKPIIEPLIEAKHVIAWKAVGAGGGGCAMLLVRPSTQDLVKQSCESAGWSIIEWGFDENGLTIESE